MAETLPQASAETQLHSLGQEIDDLRQSLRRTVVEEAAKIGQRLLQAKRLCRHGAWLPWLAERQISERSAQNYMKLANKLYELARSNPKRRSDFINMTYQEALLATRLEDKPYSPPPTDELSTKRRFEQKRADAIGQLAKKAEDVAGRYGARAVDAALSTIQNPDAFQTVNIGIGNITDSLMKRPAPALVIDAVPDEPPSVVVPMPTASPTEQARAATTVKPAQELMDSYLRLRSQDQHIVAKQILEHQLRQTDLLPKQKAGLAKVLEVLTDYTPRD